MPRIPAIARLSSLLMVALMAGCSLFFDTPDVAVKDIDVIGIDPGGVDLEILLAITNPNRFDITLTGYTYDLQVQAIPFAKGESSRKSRFPSRERVETRLPVRVTFSSLSELLKRRPDLDRIPYTLDGTLTVDTPLGEKVVPINKSDHFSIPERYRPSGLVKSLGTLFKKVIPGTR
ncbi:MAG: LEA type 2 family protein [Desulfuromonadia bacterium]